MYFKRYASLIVGCLFLILAVALWAMPMREETHGGTDYVITVTAGRVDLAHSRRTARFSGVTRAAQRAILSFSIPARVAARHIDVGAKVRKGKALANLDAGEYRNAVDLATASLAELTTQLAQAVRDRRRYETLAASDVIPEARLEAVVTREASLAANVKAARARLNESRRLLDETILRAPFSGTVTGVHIQPGEWAVPGQPAIEMTGNDNIELLVEVPETVVSQLSAGQPATVTLPFSGNRAIKGRITSVAKSALSQGQLFPVKVELNAAEGVSAGMTAQLVIHLPAQDILTVPLSAVVNPGTTQPHLFVYREGHVERRGIQLGDIIGQRIAVAGQISPTDQVITSGQSMLVHGDRVEVFND